MEQNIFLPFVLVLIVSLGGAFSQTPTQPIVCSARSNTSCEECLNNVTCLWCYSNKKCIDYPVKNILPPKSLCELSSARWGVCWVDFQALIITISVLAGILLLSIIICCCCCCRKKRNPGPDKDEEKIKRQNEQRKIRQEERKNEMRMRHEEIRQKYGLTKETPYSRFENS
ncbi:PTTG1 interacting protein b [Erpetoichthys calabaricus]|uniref:Pituitary tumor-transforming gene 1 protein-interacting protein-like n=1 Tax=Erpetoichthys calabaricus TaxID=27687 RepID=A0A8C4X7D3_ERPCA|nr:PTTG1 interacting protein b [Erpetoichthys calabaricus]